MSTRAHVHSTPQTRCPNTRTHTHTHRHTHTHTHTHTLYCLSAACATHPSLFSASFRNHHNGAASKKRKLLPQAHSLLPFIVFNKASLLIQRGKREEKGREQKKKKGGEKKKGERERGEQKGKSKQFWVSSHFSLRTEGWKKKSIMEHTWILFRAPSHPLAARPLENQITQQTYRLL